MKGFTNMKIISWISLMMLLWHSAVYAEVTQEDIDSLKSTPLELKFAYYTANSKTADNKLKWYISATGGSLDGYIFSLGEIETINGVEKVSWREVSSDAASIDLVAEEVVVGAIADNPSYTFQDWGLGVMKTNPSIQEAIELIRNSTVNVRWWFFQAPNNSWYIIDKFDNIYKFGTLNGEYNWEVVNSDNFDMEFYMSGGKKMIRPIVPPTLADSIFSVSEDATAGALLTGNILVDYDGGRPITAMSLSGVGSANFEINASGAIHVATGAVLDYERITEYNLTAYATNSVGDGEPIAVNISVANVTDTVATLANTAIDIANGTSAGSIVGNVSIVDSGDSAIASMTLSGTNASDFSIAANGVISTTAEMNASKVSEYNLSAIATNGAGDSQAVDVNLSIDVSPIGDQDSDGIPDSIEILIGTNPALADEDGDGVMDGLQLSGSKGDAFFDKQWHLNSLGTQVNDSGVATIVGNDLGLLELYHKYMGYNEGTPIIVQVVDDGVDANHEDLVDNMDLSRSSQHSGGTITVGDPSPQNSESTHGTKVAGIMAARAFNGVGLRGIAPFAKIAGSNWIEDQTSAGLEKVWLTGDGANEIAVSNNSWGAYFSNGNAYEYYLKQGSETLRDGKGRIYVFAAGNERGDAGNSNLSYVANNRYAIAVAALKHDNTYASYSSPGGNVLISGYSGEFYQDAPTIGTTTVEGSSSNTGDLNTKTTWSEDTAQNYTFGMNGTSAASPVVAGCIALVLEACPSLTYRDVKYLLAKHGKKVDSSNATWQQNGGGLWHSTDYGYGLVNPQGMIDDCTSTYVNLPAEKTFEVFSEVNATLANGATRSFSTIIEDANSSIVEWIELSVDSNYTRPEDFVVSLTAPSGAKSKVVDWNYASGAWMDGGFRFGVAGFVDENSSGQWSVEIADADTVNTASADIKSIKLKFYGH